jgi:hypothetical protein
MPSGNVESGSAPPSSSAFTPSTAPPRTAKPSALNVPVLVDRVALGAGSQQRRDRRPVVRGGRPHQRRLAITPLFGIHVAPAAINASIVGTSPVRAAVINNVLASANTTLASAPASSSAAHHGRTAVLRGEIRSRIP